jgi:hypothetical protein
MKDQKLMLKIEEVLRGDFQFNKLNLLLVFQVNCPGCFIYALPIANKLVEDFAEENFKMLGLSTAFEDFELNTLENTRQLLSEGKLVGETLKILKQTGYEKWPFPFNFDLAFDMLIPQGQFNIEEESSNYLNQLEDFEKQTEKEQDRIRLQVKEYFHKKKFKAYSFDGNYLSGTPSWGVFLKKIKKIIKKKIFF